MGNTPGRHDIPEIASYDPEADYLEPRVRGKRPRGLSTHEARPTRSFGLLADDYSPECRLLALPTELIQLICGYDGSPWSIASACATTRRIWKTTGTTVVVSRTSDLAAASRTFPDAGKVVLVLQRDDIRPPVPPLLSIPAFPRATSLAVHLGPHTGLRNSDYPAFESLVLATVRCSAITTCKLKFSSYTGRGAASWMKVLPAMPALTRLSTHTEFYGEMAKVLRAIRQSFQSITELRISGSLFPDHEWDALIRAWNGADTSNIEILRIDASDPIRDLEPRLRAIEASHPQLRQFVIRMPDYRRHKLARRAGGGEEKALASLAPGFSFVRIEWPFGVNLPATMYPSPRTPIGAKELERAYCAIRDGVMPRMNTLPKLLRYIRPAGYPFLERGAYLVYTCRIAGGCKLSEEPYASIIKTALLSGPATATRKSRRWAKWKGKTFGALRESVVPYTDDHELLQDLLREIARSYVHFDVFAEAAFGIRNPEWKNPTWIQDLSCKKHIEW